MSQPAKIAKIAMSLRVKRLSEHAVLPVRASAHAAGYDLSRFVCVVCVATLIYSAHDCIVPAHGKALIPTDLAIAVPEGTYGRVGT